MCFYRYFQVPKTIFKNSKSPLLRPKSRVTGNRNICNELDEYVWKKDSNYKWDLGWVIYNYIILIITLMNLLVIFPYFFSHQLQSITYGHNYFSEHHDCCQLFWGFQLFCDCLKKTVVQIRTFKVQTHDRGDVVGYVFHLHSQQWLDESIYVIQVCLT